MSSQLLPTILEDQDTAKIAKLDDIFVLSGPN